MTLKRVMWIASACCVALYVFGYWCEAARHAGAFGFNEAISWPRFTEALWSVSWADFAKVYGFREDRFLDLFVLAGAVLTATLAAKLHHDAWRNATATVLAVYFAALVLFGGWRGVLTLPFMPWMFPIDGEFFDDGPAADLVRGIWAVTVAALAWTAWRQKET